jgi:hypothetical protein
VVQLDSLLLRLKKRLRSSLPINQALCRQAASPEKLAMNWINIFITPAFGALVGFAVWYFQSRLEAINRAKESLHAERRKAYSDVLDPFIRIFAGIKNPQEHAKAMKHILSYEYKKAAFEFSLIGADDVVRSFNELMGYIYSSSDSESPSPGDLLKYWGLFLLEIRKNVGNPETKLLAADMLRSQIKDIDEVLKQAT